MNENRLTILKNHTFSLLGLGNIELITLDKCGLEVIEAQAFDGLHRLKSLTLSYNTMSAEMLSTALHGLSSSPLDKMSLSGLKLHNLNHETFAPLGASNITDLRLDGCGIKILRTGVFDNLSNLRRLSLSNNMIVVQVQMNVFSPLSHFETLAFGGNWLIECLNVKTAGLSSSVLHIKMHDNKIDQVNKACVRGLDNLIEYDLHGNTLKNIGAKSFIGSNISTILLGGNQISRLANETFTNMSNLKTLNLVGNTIQLIETGYFDGLNALEFLQLSKNPLLGHKILQLAIGFKNLHSLKELACNTCGIEDLSTDIFTNMRNINKLSLHSNYIVTWHPDLFIHQQNLEKLYLEKNRIVTLNQDMFQYLSILQEIKPYGNPFVCTCDIMWFRSWITDGVVYAYIDVSRSMYQCASPPSEDGISLLEVDLSFSKCGPIQAVIGGAIGGAVFVLILITAGLTYRYRWYIRHGHFLLQRRMQQRRNENNNNVEFAYDAFVSYNHGDQQWVIERLLPALEYRGGVHLCLHDRDWIAGCLIADNIIESIENSRKTVLVLSNNFAQSEWCQLEMSMAQHKLLTSRKDVLVLVMKGNIDDAHMSRTLRHLVSTQTYLAWDPHDEEKQRLFWKALIKAIKNGTYGD